MSVTRTCRRGAFGSARPFALTPVVQAAGFLWRALFCLFFCLVLLPGRGQALQSSLSLYESELAASEKRLAEEGDALAWNEWRALLGRVIAESGKSEWPKSFLNDLAMRGKEALARYAAKDAEGLHAKALWADALREMAQAGADLPSTRAGELSRGDRKQLARLWMLAHLAWQDYLHTRDSRGAFADFLGAISGEEAPKRDTRTAWKQWWTCLRRYCETTPGIADKDIALVRATTTLRVYSEEYPGDRHAWNAWSRMLLWQGAGSADPAVRTAFFEDASAKYRQVLDLDEYDGAAWAYWLETLQTLYDKCSSDEECDALQKQLEFFNHGHRRRFVSF